MMCASPPDELPLFQFRSDFQKVHIMDAILDLIKSIPNLIPDLGELLHIFVGLLKGDGAVLSTSGSFDGIFGGDGLGSSAADVAGE
jgi:hypothetical protein